MLLFWIASRTFRGAFLFDNLITEKHTGIFTFAALSHSLPTLMVGI